MRRKGRAISPIVPLFDISAENSGKDISVDDEQIGKVSYVAMDYHYEAAFFKAVCLLSVLATFLNPGAGFLVSSPPVLLSKPGSTGNLLTSVPNMQSHASPLVPCWSLSDVRIQPPKRLSWSNANNVFLSVQL